MERRANYARTVMVMLGKDFDTWERTARVPLIKQTTSNRAFPGTFMLLALVAHSLWAACHVAVKAALTSAECAFMIAPCLVLRKMRVKPLVIRTTTDNKSKFVSVLRWPWNCCLISIELFAWIGTICKDWRLLFSWARRQSVRILGDGLDPNPLFTVETRNQRILVLRNFLTPVYSL